MTFYDHRYAYMRHLFANMNPRSFLLHIRNSYGIMQQRLREGRCMKKSRAATRTIKILEVISQAAKGLSLSEIAAALDMPITSVSDIVRALVEEELSNCATSAASCTASALKRSSSAMRLSRTPR